ncbi:MAG: LytR C-terminal domain-containing protein [Candidatus Moranbacteria bacterium]|nr:LytR C-terminal domain-containing protein [Candidatus Moranbacteria bacterium]
MFKIQKYLSNTFIIFLFIFCLLNNNFALAENEKIEIKSGTNKFKDLIFSVSPDSQHTGELIVHNKSEDDIDIVLFIAPDEKTTLVETMKAKEGNDLFFNTLFYFDAPPEKYQNLLKDNGGNITILCDENKANNDKAFDDKALKKWCEGDRSTTLTVKAGTSEHIPFTIKISQDAQNHQAYVTAVLEDKYDDKVLAQEKLIYQIPVEKVEVGEVKFESFTFKRSFSLFNIIPWWKAGRREEHLAEFVVDGDDNLEVSHQTFVKVKSSDKEKFYKLDVITKAGESNIYNIKVLMPWFGKVEILGGIKMGEGEKVQEFVSEKITYFIIPVREIIAVLLILSFALIMMWRKKEDLSNVVGGISWVKYKIKQNDNIMSVSYRYGISWKELIYKNKINPPYTLISGNVIMVPPRPKKVFKNTFMQNKNYFENQGKKSVQKKSFLNQIKVNVKGEDGKNVSQMAEQNISERKSVNNRESNFRDSTKSSTVRSTENLNREKSSRNIDLRNQQQSVNGGVPKRGMDIRWMHEDDDAFDDAMQDEVRAINFKIKIFIVVIIGLLGLVAWWFYQYGMSNELSTNKSSINDLLASDNQEETDNETDNEVEKEVDENEKTNENDDQSNVDSNNPDSESVEDDNDKAESDANDLVIPSEISVQVLNGGAKSGIAGDLTNIFKNKNYQIKTAANANNNVAGVVVYYKSGLDKEVMVLAKNISSGYGEVRLEESDDVAKKYGVDVIVVVGK